LSPLPFFSEACHERPEPDKTSGPRLPHECFLFLTIFMHHVLLTPPARQEEIRHHVIFSVVYFCVPTVPVRKPPFFESIPTFFPQMRPMEVAVFPLRHSYSLMQTSSREPLQSSPTTRGTHFTVSPPPRDHPELTPRIRDLSPSFRRTPKAHFFPFPFSVRKPTRSAPFLFHSIV